MNAFKKKLQKDLKWINNIYVKAILAIVIGGVEDYPDESIFWFTIIGAFIVIYLFSAWLFAEEEMQNVNEDEKVKEQ